jgi:predicted dehydrogenase
VSCSRRSKTRSPTSRSSDTLDAVPPVRIAVIGAGSFGRNHLRVLRSHPQAQLTAVIDSNADRAALASAEFGCSAVSSLDELTGIVDAAVVAVPTSAHDTVACQLLESGIDVLVEKPIASDAASARRMVDTARKHARILQVGHLERFNPAVIALRRITTTPLFFEIHRMSVFTPRSLDVDVVLDLMIHDVDIVLNLVGCPPEEIRAAGLRILTDKVDIANVRLAFPTGCIANLTASRVSTERVRKLRVFQPSRYISLDYQRQDLLTFNVRDAPDSDASKEIHCEAATVEKGEPLKLELEAFLQSVATRSPAPVTGEEGLAALEVALDILAKIEEHTERVRGQLVR